MLKKEFIKILELDYKALIFKVPKKRLLVNKYPLVK